MTDTNIYRALASIAGTYRPGRRIGAGSYGIVYEVFSVSDGTPFAAKFLPPSSVDGHNFISDDAIRELRATADHVDTPGVITFENVVIFDDLTVCFVMKRYDCTLANVLKSVRLSAASARSIFSQLVAAIGALHRLGTCHRDLKPENILLDLTAGRVVVADLGSARDNVEAYHDHPVLLTGRVATCGYAPIETLLPTKSYTCAMDIWALGVILFEMLVGKKPFPPCLDRAAHAKIILGVHGVPAGCELCHDAPGGTCGAETACPRSFLKQVCCQVFGATSSLPSRLTGIMAAAGVDVAAQELILDSLSYLPGKRPGAEAVSRSRFLVDGDGGSRKWDLDLLDALRELAGEVPVLSVLPVLPLLESRLPLKMLTMFTLPSPKTSTITSTSTSTSTSTKKGAPVQFSWLLNGADCKDHLLYLLDFFLLHCEHAAWCVEAWLVAIALSRTGTRHVPDTIDRLAAYITYALALTASVTAMAGAPSYDRYAWTERIPLRVLDVFYVAREEAGIIAQLRGQAPRIEPSVWKEKARECAEPQLLRAFLERSIQS